MEDIKLPFFPSYIEEHKHLLVPPVCNKMIHNDGKLRVMIVGGPNQRKDYHLNLGQELFYQIKGDMCLKVMEKGQPKDIVIKQGEMFMLPGQIPHSPQRFEDTIGLVIERVRPDDELDGLRYYVDDTNQDVLWQRFFHVTDLGKQLKPLIESYFASEEFKSRVPSPEMPPTAWEPNSTLELPPPFPLESKFPLVSSSSSSDTTNNVKLFETEGEFTLHLLGGGSSHFGTENLPLKNECWVWLMHGSGTVNGTVPLTEGDSFITFSQLSSLELSEGSQALLIYTTHKV